MGVEIIKVEALRLSPEDRAYLARELLISLDAMSEADIERLRVAEAIRIIRRGKRVARLVAVGGACKRLPDLRRFRDSISVKGESLNAMVIQGREEERY